MKFLIFYFSGTGNTWWLTDQLKKLVQQDNHTFKAYSIEKIQDTDWHLISQHWINADWIGFLHPVYGSDAPRIMKDFLKNLPINLTVNNFPQKLCFLFTTMEIFSGNGGFALKKFLSSLHLQLQYVFNFQMVSNLGIPIMKYNPRKPAKFEKRRVKTQKKLENVYNDLLKKRKYIQNRYNPFAYIFGWLQRIGMRPIEQKNAKFLGVNLDRCIKCMKCVNNCPTHSIIYEDNNFQFNMTCTACYRCYNFCPTHAITVFNRTPKDNRHRQHQTYMGKPFY